MKDFVALLDQLTLGLDTQTLTLGDAAERVARHVQGVIGCSQVGLWVLDPLPGGLRVRRIAGYDGVAGQALPEVSDVCDGAVAASFDAIARHGVMASADALADERLAPLREHHLRPQDIRAVLYATIGANGSTRALLSCVQRGATRHWTAREQRVLKTCADAISLRRARRQRREAEARSLAQRLLQAEGAVGVGKPADPA